MDLKRQVSISDINPKSFKNEKNKTSTQISNVLSGTKPTMATDPVSPLKRKMSSTQTEMTSLSCDSKRRRHHRRKPNKKWRHKSVTGEESNKSIISQRETASVGVAMQPNCQKKSRKEFRNEAKAKVANSIANQSAWKRKRKGGQNNFFHHPQHYNNSSSTAAAGASAGSNTGQHGNAGVPGTRMPFNPNGVPGRKRTNVVLRPTKVPLLNAPRNSTQFIIDDHESSDLVWNFEAKIPGQRKQLQKDLAVAAER